MGGYGSGRHGDGLVVSSAWKLDLAYFPMREGMILPGQHVAGNDDLDLDPDRARRWPRTWFTRGGAWVRLRYTSTTSATGVRRSNRRGTHRQDLAAYYEKAATRCAGTPAAHQGSYIHSLVLTDIASGRTEAAPIVVREGSLVDETLERVRLGLPFALRALDVDNGSEFVNNRLIECCLGHGIELYYHFPELDQHARSRDRGRP